MFLLSRLFPIFDLTVMEKRETPLTKKLLENDIRRCAKWWVLGLVGSRVRRYAVIDYIQGSLGVLPVSSFLDGQHL